MEKRLLSIVIEVLVLVIGWYTTGLFIAAIDDEEEPLPTFVRVIVWIVGMVAAGVSYFNLGATIALVVLLIAVLIIARYLDDEDKSVVARLGFMMGVPAAVAIIAHVLVRIIFNKTYLVALWLLAPIIYYVALIVYSQMLTVEEEEEVAAEEGKKPAREPFKWHLVLTIVLATAVAGTMIFARAKGVL